MLENSIITLLSLPIITFYLSFSPDY